MGKVYYFAYNHHMDSKVLIDHQITLYTSESAVLKGYQLVFNVMRDELVRMEHIGLPNIAPRSKSQVEGVLYTIDEDDLETLDEIYEVSSLRYYRKQVKLYNSSGKRISALTYAGWPDVTSQGLLPSGRDIRQLIRAASHYPISEYFLHWLRNHPTAG